MTLVNNNKKTFLYSFLFTLAFFLLAHGYRFSNNLFAGDSLTNLYQIDSSWQIAIGRIFEPVYLMFRGTLGSPWITSLLAIIYYSLAIYFLADLFKFNNLHQILLVSGIFTCNITITATNAAYVHCLDMYALALLFAILGVWLIGQQKICYIIGGTVSLALSLSLYQAYIAVAIFLVMFIILFDLSEKAQTKSILKKLLKFFICFFCSALLYFLLWKLFQKIFNIWTADSYNGLSSVGDYSDTPILGLFTTTYKMVFDYFFNPAVFKSLVYRQKSLSIVWTYLLRISSVLTAVLTIVMLIKKNIDEKTNFVSRLLQVLIILLLPLGVNFTCLISKGMVHTLMVFPFVMLYIPAICLVFPENKPKLNTLKILISFSLFIFIWNNIVFSNQVYLKKSFQDKANQSLMTKIVYEIEHMDGYQPGVTPVAFVGSFQKTDYINDTPDMEDIVLYGMGKSSMLYEGNDYAYLKYELNTNMNLTRVDWNHPGLSEMPCYPSAGSIKNCDGIIVVKISDR